MNYTLTIGKNLQAADGSKLGEQETIKFKTLDQQKSTRVYMILMAVSQPRKLRKRKNRVQASPRL